MFAACVYWDYVIGLCAGLLVADCADWLFSKYDPPVFLVLGVVVVSAHNALARRKRLAVGLLCVMQVDGSGRLGFVVSIMFVV